MDFYTSIFLITATSAFINGFIILTFMSVISKDFVENLR